MELLIILVNMNKASLKLNNSKKVLVKKKSNKGMLVDQQKTSRMVGESAVNKLFIKEIGSCRTSNKIKTDFSMKKHSRRASLNTTSHSRESNKVDRTDIKNQLKSPRVSPKPNKPIFRASKQLLGSLSSLKVKNPDTYLSYSIFIKNKSKVLSLFDKQKLKTLGATDREIFEFLKVLNKY